MEVAKEGWKVAKVATRATATTEKQVWLKVWHMHAQAVVAWEAEKARLIKENPRIRKKDLPTKPCVSWKTTQGGGNGAGPSP